VLAFLERVMSFEHTNLDFYDDGGALLKETFSSRSSLPDFVKSAAVLSEGTAANQYALVLLEDGRALKKFATADAGNAFISAVYFAKTRHALPIEAQKVAAANLREALLHFQIDVPSALQKVAGSPWVPSTNVVDVTGKSAPRIVRDQADDSEYALEMLDGSKRYPLDNAESVKTALSYFELNHAQFVPRQRREYAVKVASVALQHGLPLGEEMRKHAGAGFSRLVPAHLDLRADLLSDPDYTEELQKLASQHEAQQLSPEEFAGCLEAFDHASGLSQHWGGAILDPWQSTIAPLEKVARGSVSTHTFQVGNETITEHDLMVLKKTSKTLVDHFGHDFAVKFSEDPVTFFAALPLPQQRVVGTMARNASSAGLH
jgi:hypothetical protein